MPNVPNKSAAMCGTEIASNDAVTKNAAIWFVRSAPHPAHDKPCCQRHQRRTHISKTDLKADHRDRHVQRGGKLRCNRGRDNHRHRRHHLHRRHANERSSSPGIYFVAKSLVFRSLIAIVARRPRAVYIVRHETCQITCAYRSCCGG